MIKQNKITRERIDISVDDEQGTYTGQIEVDKSVGSILGVVMTSNRDDLLMLRGSFKLTINDEEFFPESTEAKVLMCGFNIYPHKRFNRFENPVEPGNRKVEFRYVDNASSAADFVPYSVYLSIIGRLKDDTQ